MVKTITKRHRTSMGRTVDEQVNVVYCDGCGLPEHEASTNGAEDTIICWESDDARVAETHISCITGTAWRADGSQGRVKRVEVHLCPTCFTTKLLPWLKTQRIKPSVWRHDAGDRP